MITLPIIRPVLPSLEEFLTLLRPSWESGMVTNGSLVKELEKEACRQTQAAHAVAMSSCTSGLILVPRALKLRPGGEVIVPSFTFTATAQALLWNGLAPVFCDCLPGTCTLDPQDVEQNLTANTVAICAVSIYGIPPDIDALLDIGRRKGIPVYFDSAQGLGATYRGQPLGGFGACEVFSLSPTKVVTAVEGGVVTTNDSAVASRLRSMRDYGRDLVGGEDMIDLGLSARMSELHAAVGLWSMQRIHDWGKARMARIQVYRERLGALPGCWVQEFPENRTTSGNYFVLFVTAQAKRNRDEVYAALYEAGIQTKRYFHPPLHEQKVFQQLPHRVSRTLQQTIKTSQEGLALPLYSDMGMDQLDTVCQAVETLLG